MSTRRHDIDATDVDVDDTDKECKGKKGTKLQQSRHH